MTTIRTTLERKTTSNLAVQLARFREIGIIIFLFLIVAGATAAQPRFLTPFNLRSILLWIPLITVVAMGEMMVLITRGIDVSIGSSMALAGIIVGMIFRDFPGFNIYLGTLLAILTGLVLGAINGA